MLLALYKVCGLINCNGVLMSRVLNKSKKSFLVVIFESGKNDAGLFLNDIMLDYERHH